MQSSDRFGFTLESLHGVHIRHRAKPQDLERDAPTERFLFGFEHRAHATPPDLADDHEVANPLRSVRTVNRGCAAETFQSLQSAFERLRQLRILCRPRPRIQSRIHGGFGSILLNQFDQHRGL